VEDHLIDAHNCVVEPTSLEPVHPIDQLRMFVFLPAVLLMEYASCMVVLTGDHLGMLCYAQSPSRDVLLAQVLPCVTKLVVEILPILAGRPWS